MCTDADFSASSSGGEFYGLFWVCVCDELLLSCFLIIKGKRKKAVMVAQDQVTRGHALRRYEKE